MIGITLYALFWLGFGLELIAPPINWQDAPLALWIGLAVIEAYLLALAAIELERRWYEVRRRGR